MSILRKVNALLPAAGRRFELYRNDGGEDQSLILCIDRRYRSAFERDRAWKFYGPSDWKRMGEIFADREQFVTTDDD